MKGPAPDQADPDRYVGTLVLTAREASLLRTLLAFHADDDPATAAYDTAAYETLATKLDRVPA